VTEYAPRYTPLKERPSLAYLASQRVLAPPAVVPCPFCFELAWHRDAEACRNAIDYSLRTTTRVQRVGNGRKSRARGRR
jgi:hypothetical protein